MTLKTVADISRKFNNDLGFALQPSHDTQQAVRLAHSKVKTLLTQDRQAIATALLTALEGMKKPTQIYRDSDGNLNTTCMYIPGQDETGNYKHNCIIEDLEAIVNELLPSPTKSPD